MARLVIVVEVDTDPTATDSDEVACDLMWDERMGDGVRQYEECATSLVSAEWADEQE